MAPKMLCTGDPILDIYIDEEGHMRTFKGGALNVYSNILALLEEHWFSGGSDNLKFAWPNDGDVVTGDIFTQYTILRTPLHPEGIPLTSKYEKNIFYECSGIAESIIDFQPNILVLADYDKGTLTMSSELVLPEIDVAIADSRYRSLHQYWLSSSKLKLWHATADEYDQDWANNFDYTFWTNGAEPVKILRDGNIIATLPVPQETNVVDTCGSGDTFTATVAAFIYANDPKQLSDEKLIEYAAHAIEVCQDVVKQPYTSTTKKRIQHVHYESRGSNTVTET